MRRWRNGGMRMTSMKNVVGLFFGFLLIVGGKAIGAGAGDRGVTHPDTQ